MITDAELIARLRETDPAAGPAGQHSDVWSDDRVLSEIEARIENIPSLEGVQSGAAPRWRWLAVAAAVLVVGGLGYLIASSLPADDDVAIGGADDDVAIGGRDDADDGTPQVTESAPLSAPSHRIERVATSGLGNGHIRSAVAAGPGVVAVGDQAAVWTSADGSSWSRIEIDVDGIEIERFDVTLNDVTVGGPGFIAVGAINEDAFFGVPEPQMEARARCLAGELDLCDPRLGPVETGAGVWTSPDGMTWTRSFTEISPSSAAMHAVAAGGPGFVAVGSSVSGGEVWTSVDGLNWSLVADDGAVFAGHQILELVSTPAGLIAVGSAVWASEDGSAWRLVSEVEDPWYEQGDSRLGIRSVVVGPNGYVGVGFSGIWTSVDGLQWLRVPDINDVIVNSHLDTVYADESGYVAFGQGSMGGPGAAFVSTDGVTWTEIPYEESAQPDDVVVIEGRVLVVGSAQSGTGESPTVWELVEANVCPVDGCDVAVSSDIPYADGRDLDVYAPTESAAWPVVVVVHGLGQSRREFAPLAEAVASQGAVVFNISARFSVPPLDGIGHIACAVRFARANATAHGGDPDSITLVGNSSGAAKGSIVAMDGDEFGEGCVVSDASALPDALVGYEGPYDYATHLYGSFDVPGLREEDPETWEAVDPYSHIGGNQDLVVRLIHGRDDDVAWFDVPPEVSAEFHQALAAAGYDVELTYVDGVSHGALASETEAYDITIEQVLEVARR